MSDNSSTIVVGVDGTESAVDAARWAGALAEALGCSLRLVHSMATTPHEIADATVIAIRAADPESQHDVAAKILNAAEQAVRRDHPSIPITTEAVTDPVDHALIKRGHDARLIVLGCVDVSPAAALLVGSTTMTVATHAACPVVAWRGQSPWTTKAPIVVGVDGSDTGAVALSTAFAIADQLNAPLRAVLAYTTPPASNGVTIPFLIDWEQVEAAELARLKEVVDHHEQRHPGVEVQYFVELAKPAHALLGHTDGAQLVVVGSRGHNRLASVVLGSTGLNLLHHSKIPVMICHRANAG
ncbi:MAG: universal stress protein [Mycobacterium sp.]